MKLDYRIGLKQVSYELEKQVEEMLWNKWLSIYPNMNPDNFISFNEFKEQHKPRKMLDESDKARIDRQVEAIRKKVVNK